jgi:glyoxylase-like metal-dependent hydrolase (beta-lactamase superfamily II)
MKILRPYKHVFGFYDGRVEGVRAYSPAPNWLDDGAYALGICSYAIMDGSEALVYDTHISLDHARLIRRTLEAEGVSSIRVLLSHWHDDHVAGNEVFADCEILASAGTFSALAAHREQMETANPPIKPLVMPNRMLDGDVTLHVGNIAVEVRHVDIHSFDAAVLLLPESGVLLAGDTLEDPITYVDEPGRLHIHLQDLERMAGWDVRHILPNHGRADVIEAGGYGVGFIDATRVYVEALLKLDEDKEGAARDLRSFVPDVFAGGAMTYFAAYEEVHERNVWAVLGLGGVAGSAIRLAPTTTCPAPAPPSPLHPHPKI